jgi:hypothetical protein
MRKQNYTEQNAEAIYATKQMEIPNSETKGENLSHRKILLYSTFLKKKLLKRFAVIQNLSQLQENATILSPQL